MYLVATDGACKGNPGPGTWAFVVFDPKTKEMLGHRKGHKNPTTNNEQELTAILEALLWANKHNKDVQILTDSSYCFQGITMWMRGWSKKAWKGSTGSQIKNKDLWKQVHNLWNDDKHTIQKVKGHSGNKFNDAADMYCNEEYLNTFI